MYLWRAVDSEGGRESLRPRERTSTGGKSSGGKSGGGGVSRLSAIPARALDALAHQVLGNRGGTEGAPGRVIGTGRLGKAVETALDQYRQRS